MKRARMIVGLLVIIGLWGGVLGVTAAQPAPEVLRLGLLAAADSPAGRGAQLAIAEVNGAGGITGPDGMRYVFELLSVPVESASEVRAGVKALADRDVMAVLGPSTTDAALAAFNDLRALNVPVLTAASGDALTIADTDDRVFRSRAPEQVYVNGMAAYLAALPEQPSVVVVEITTGQSNATMTGLAAALNAHGLSPRSSFLLDDSANLDDLVTNLQNLAPDVLAVWGAPEVAADLLIQLHEAGWEGAYFFRDAADARFREPVLAAMGTVPGGIRGVTNWVPGVHGPVSDGFLLAYVTTFGTVPDERSAAYYDAVYLLTEAVQAEGGTPEDVRRGLQTQTEYDGVQGVFDPAQFVIGETINAAALYELNVYGVPQVLSLFVDGVLRSNGDGPAPVAVLPTATAAASTATPTITPTATPEGVYGIVDSFRLNVRTGPSTNYDVIGQFEIGDTLFPIGGNADLTWLVVPFRGTSGWVAAYLVEMHGNLNDLPIIVPPPSPTPVLTSTPTPVPYPDLIIETASVQPVQPLSGQPFVVRAIVRNAGNTASAETALAATFLPGDVYVAAVIPSLAPAQAIQVDLTPTVTGSGTYSVQLVADLNNVVNEGPAGEANNLYTVPYTLDHTVLRTGTVPLNPGQQHDPVGTGTMNLGWDGATLSAVNGAQIAVLPGLNWDTLQYNQLGGVVGSSVPRASLPAGVVVGLVTAPDGYRGALRIDGYSGDTLQYTYRIYGP